MAFFKAIFFAEIGKNKNFTKITRMYQEVLLRADISRVRVGQSIETCHKFRLAAADYENKILFFFEIIFEANKSLLDVLQVSSNDLKSM